MQLSSKFETIKNHGVQDLFIACVDSLTGFPEAIAATYPDPGAIVHRASGEKLFGLCILQAPQGSLC
jgi:hypothetical protein